MSKLNSLKLNDGTINNFFAPPSGKNAIQIATASELKSQAEEKNVRPDSANVLKGLLVQDTLSGSPEELRSNALQPVIKPVSIEKRVYSGIFFCLSKTSRYMQLKQLNFYDTTGAFIQDSIRDPRDTAIRSKQNPGDDLKKLYQAQFQLLSGPTSDNAFVAGFAEPLPGALSQGDFVQELTPSSAEASAQKWLIRAGLIEVDIAPAVNIINSDLSNSSNDEFNLTPLEVVCLQKRL